MTCDGPARGTAPAATAVHEMRESVDVSTFKLLVPIFCCPSNTEQDACYVRYACHVCYVRCGRYYVAARNYDEQEQFILKTSKSRFESKLRLNMILSVLSGNVTCIRRRYIPVNSLSQEWKLGLRQSKHEGLACVTTLLLYLYTTTTVRVLVPLSVAPFSSAMRLVNNVVFLHMTRHHSTHVVCYA